MKKLEIVGLTLLVYFAFTIVATGQSIQDKIAKFEKPKEYQFTYDKFKDRTSIFSAERNLKDDKKHLLDLRSYVSIIFAGTEPKDETHYFLAFRSHTVEWQYLRSHHAILLVDGERMDLGDGYRSGEVASGWVYENLSYLISSDQLKQLAKASTVEVQVGSTEGSMPPDMLQIIKNMATLID